MIPDCAVGCKRPGLLTDRGFGAHCPCTRSERTPMPRRIAALALFLVFAYPATAGAHSIVRHGAPNHRITRSTSTNWAGYSATSGTFTSVSATWKQPAVKCTADTAYSSFWVGLDG